MEIRFETEDSETIGLLAFLQASLAGDYKAEWQKALKALLTLNNPKHSAGVLTRRGIAMPSPEFPLYEMVVEDKRSFMPFREAYVTFDNGFLKVDTGKFVLEAGFKLRPMDNHDKKKISDAADEYSGSK